VYYYVIELHIWTRSTFVGLYQHSKKAISEKGRPRSMISIAHFHKFRICKDTFAFIMIFVMIF